ncbi:folate-binding protein [Pelomonas sp. SE-A7]|uniref:CAF17-like 4Fe-4S cluster assembly/insertion protein YgfZ n=1 Tax=Pelomonas sp. SE-A7 TaxID=3054953 RepID=UPI00259C7618|nr:folate-binding protein [Pelomonas sp. SE-A7]MDM4765164.1 folate-binding protein [Pelomonas sp. SE-A7]
MTENSKTSGALRLADWGLIRAQGEEAAKFLHGQLTQDVVLQTPNQGRLAGYCSAKGRLLALMLAYKRNSDELVLALPSELLPATLKRLSMFVLRAKCKLSDASNELALWGLAGEAARAALGDQAPAEVWAVTHIANKLVMRLPDALVEGQSLSRYALLQAADEAAPALPALTAETWQWLEVQAGLAWVRGATVEQFVPQMLNLELLGGVNFQKGCYPGQEIVARSQYRGTIKRRTFLFKAEGPAQVGQELFHSADAEQPAGLVAAVGTDQGQVLLLAEVKLAALEDGSLHLGSATGPQLQQRPLPYEIAEPQ